MNFGAVGQNSYNAIGSENGGLDGYPYQSYAVHVVLGAHSRAAVETQVAEVETVQGVTLNATKGVIRTSGPAGVARSDTTTYQPVGWNPVYGTWELDAASDDTASFAVTVPVGSSLVNPVFVVHGYGATDAAVTVGGALLTADVDYFMSIDADNSTLWLTLRRTLAATTTVSIQP